MADFLSDFALMCGLYFLLNHYITSSRFIEKFTDIMMTFSAYMNELECWKHEDLDRGLSAVCCYSK